MQGGTLEVGRARDVSMAKSEGRWIAPSSGGYSAVSRSAATGRFVTRAAVTGNPKTTVVKSTQSATSPLRIGAAPRTPAEERAASGAGAGDR